jgi:DNA-binding LacI/PurR family transcriptional regulator
MATTIHDVARAAGVGIGTVSRVINNSPGVRPATREKVLTAIARLNYKPDPIARSMISKRTGSIGVIVPFFTRPFFMEVLQGVEAALQLLSREKPPTAIFAASDVQAVGVLEAAKALNITVPDDLSVIGFDGIELSELLELSTVQQPIKQMGELGVSKLIEQIENPQQSPELIRLDTILIERRTTARVKLTC